MHPILPAPKSVLIVDDSELIRNALRDLIRCHFQPETIHLASDGDEAMINVINRSFSLVIMDIRMQPVDGIMALLAIRKHDPDVPVIIYSQYGYENYRALCKRYGANAFIEKGGDISILLDTLRVHLN